MMIFFALGSYAISAGSLYLASHMRAPEMEFDTATHPAQPSTCQIIEIPRHLLVSDERLAA